jgi:DNA invertase Pin-like site-specific DNA recombinase
MKLCYARVSTDDQNPDLQLAALRAAGCEKIYTDKATEANVKRPELAKCLKSLAPDDTLVVWKLDCLGRSLHDLIELLDSLSRRGMLRFSP